MKRRAVIATAGVVAVAGCADDTESTTQPTGEDHGSQPPQEDPCQPWETAGEERAAELIDDAQSALKTAIDEIAAQCGPSATFESDFDASVSLDTAPIEDALTDSRDTFAETDCLEPSSEQADVIGTLKNAGRFLRTLVALQPAVNRLHTDVGDLLRNAKAQDWQRVRRDLVSAQRAFDTLDADSVTDMFPPKKEPLEQFEGVSAGDMEVQRGRVRTEASAIESILDAVERIQDAEETFQAAHDRRFDDDAAVEQFGTGEEQFDAIAVPARGGGGFSGGLDWLACYGGGMRDAAAANSVAIERYNADGDWRDARDEADALAEQTQRCDLSM